MLFKDLQSMPVSSLTQKDSTRMECCSAVVQFVRGRGNLKELCMRCRAKPIQAANCLLSQLRNPAWILCPRSSRVSRIRMKEHERKRSMHDLDRQNGGDQIISLFSGPIAACAANLCVSGQNKGHSMKDKMIQNLWKLHFLTVIFVHVIFTLPSRYLYVLSNSRAAKGIQSLKRLKAVPRDQDDRKHNACAIRPRSIHSFAVEVLTQSQGSRPVNRLDFTKRLRCLQSGFMEGPFATSCFRGLKADFDLFWPFDRKVLTCSSLVPNSIVSTATRLWSKKNSGARCSWRVRWRMQDGFSATAHKVEHRIVRRNAKKSCEGFDSNPNIGVSGRRYRFFGATGEAPSVWKRISSLVHILFLAK